jgi:iron complex outermembrane receptor protein
VTAAILGADDNVLTVVTNAAKAAIRGLELEGDVIIGWGIRMHASSAYTGAHYIHYEDLTGDHSHQPFSVPRWTFNFGPNYTRSTSIGNVSVELDYAWKSAVNVVPTTTLVQAGTQEGYGLINARANLHLDAWNMDLAVLGQNLTNKVYFNQGVNVTAPGFDLPLLYIGGPPRTFGIEIIKKFGQQH